MSFRRNGIAAVESTTVRISGEAVVELAHELRKHPGHDITLEAEYPELRAHAQQGDPHVHACGPFLRLGIVKKLGTVDVRRDWHHVREKLDGLPAVALRLGDVLFHVSPARGADINKPC